MEQEIEAVEGPMGAERVIREEIAGSGPLRFSRFMELALYAPGVGYYATAGRAIGRGGDFYTSVSVGPVFGFLLASRFAEWCAGRERVEWVEAGAHDGRLADDVLTAVRDFHPGIFERLRYRIVEFLEVRREEQRQRLAPWAGRVEWVSAWETLRQPVEGVIFANELLDAFPIRRFGWDAAARRWFEWGVTVDAGRLVACRMGCEPGDIPGLDSWPEELLTVLPDGFVVEDSPSALDWWTRAGASLGEGRIMTLDYGHEGGAEAIRPERTGGTVRAYHRHRRVDDLLACPGEQDLTGHVDFGRVREAGEAVGLQTEALLAQGRWLGEIAVGILQRGGREAEWLTARSRQLQTLIHPAHLGQSFRVLVQRRGGERNASGRRD
jgi:SAM-dependent MidA family methyltransferase